MKKIIAEVKLLSNKSLYPRIYCIGHDGAEDEAVSLTLCDSLWELSGEPILELERLIEDAFSGKYIPRNPDLPDMSINEKLIWVRPPFANPGRICISNENLPEFSVDDGVPQCFKSDQFKLVASLILSFKTEIARRGLENLVGHRFEIDFPDS